MATKNPAGGERRFTAERERDVLAGTGRHGAAHLGRDQGIKATGRQVRRVHLNGSLTKAGVRYSSLWSG